MHASGKPLPSSFKQIDEQPKDQREQLTVTDIRPDLDKEEYVRSSTA